MWLGLSASDPIVETIIGGIILLAFIVVWRVVVTDRSVRKVRFGVFWERERENDSEDEREGET